MHVEKVYQVLMTNCRTEELSLQSYIQIYRAIVEFAKKKVN